VSPDEQAPKKGAKRKGQRHDGRGPVLGTAERIAERLQDARVRRCVLRVSVNCRAVFPIVARRSASETMMPNGICAGHAPSEMPSLMPKRDSVR
jgi:hypothetical protein